MTIFFKKGGGEGKINKVRNFITNKIKTGKTIFNTLVNPFPIIFFQAELMIQIWPICRTMCKKNYKHFTGVLDTNKN